MQFFQFSNGFLLSSLQVLIRQRNEPIGNCNNSSVIKEFAQGEENRIQLLALSQMLMVNCVGPDPKRV